MAADQVIPWFIPFLFGSETDLDRLLQAKVSDALKDLGELLRIPVIGWSAEELAEAQRIEPIDPVLAMPSSLLTAARWLRAIYLAPIPERDGAIRAPGVELKRKR